MFWEQSWYVRDTCLRKSWLKRTLCWDDIFLWQPECCRGPGDMAEVKLSRTVVRTRRTRQTLHVCGACGREMKVSFGSGGTCTAGASGVMAAEEKQLEDNEWKW